MRSALALIVALSACSDDGAKPRDAGAADAAGPADARPLPSFEANATLVPATADGLLPARAAGDGAILPGGRRITPAGETLHLGGFLLGMRQLPGGRHLITTDGGYGDENLSLIDLAEKEVVQRVVFDDDKGEALFLGLALRADGAVFASGGGSNLVYRYKYKRDAEQPLVRDGEIAIAGLRYPSGLAFVDERRLLVGFQESYVVALVDSRDGSELGRLDVDGQPYEIVVDRTRQEAWVSGWATGAVSILRWDQAGQLTLAGQVLTGKNPEGLVLYPPAAPEKLLVANSESDSISVIDLDERMVEKQIAVGPPERPMRGVTPTGLALSADGSRLYAAASGDNALDVYETAAWRHLGRVPTAWYPTAVAVLDDGRVAYASAKGFGSGPGNDVPLSGTLSLLAPPSEADLAAGATQVEANNLRMQTYGPRVDCPATGECRWPLPPRAGLPTPIEHVVLIVRENKTYDANLGDLAGTEADPNLVMFPERFTPNLHALARGFVVGDNFYSNAEASIQGHHWTTAGTTTDYIEKGWLTMWGRHTRSETEAAKAYASPEMGHYWQHLARAGVSYVSYGEIVGGTASRPGEPLFNVDRQWPGGIIFNTDSQDVLKGQYYEDKVLAQGVMPSFTYVLLPNNHTVGTTPGGWTPEYMVADNDEGTGRVVDAITRSRFWPRTAIFIIEDDPSDGYDHIDAHRSTLVVVSPWVKRGYVTKVHYDYPALWRTIEMRLGVPPLSQLTATAPPMFDLWSPAPDYSGYTFIPSNIPEARNPTRAAKPSDERMDFSEVDDAPGLGRELWRHMKHSEPPWQLPWEPADDDD